MAAPHRSIALAALAALAGAGGAAAATHDAPSQAVGDWTVTPSRDGAGCFMTRTYQRTGGTTLLLGLDVDGANHLSVLNANWSIKPKDRLKLNFHLTKANYPRHFAVGMASAGQQGFVTSFDVKFPSDFAASTVLLITRDKVTVERLPLDGSGAAVAALRQCVEGQRKAAGSGGTVRSDDIPLDPFAAARPKKPKS